MYLYIFDIPVMIFFLSSDLLFRDRTNDSFAIKLRITISNMQTSSGPPSKLDPLGDQLTAQ